MFITSHSGIGIVFFFFFALALLYKYGLWELNKTWLRSEHVLKCLYDIIS